MGNLLPADVEAACQLIEWLELHRLCLDEALAQAYTDLLFLLDQDPAGPEQARQERAVQAA